MASPDDGPGADAASTGVSDSDVNTDVGTDVGRDLSNAQLPLGDAGPAPEPRVRRRAPARRATSTPAAVEQVDVETVAPAVAPAATFGLLFQAPEPPPPKRRRSAGAPAQQVQPRVAQDDRVGGVDRVGVVDRVDQDDAGERPHDPASDAGDGEVDTDSQPRRRRRGGKGRRRSADDTAEGSAAEGATEIHEETRADGSDPETEPSDSGDDVGADDDVGLDDTGAGASSRRTRRRRRGGVVAEGADPPGTVTKVREPQSVRDEATGIKGSTRLEAKRQRRREGRDAGRRRSVITEAEFLARRESVERVMVVREAGGLTQIGVLEDGVLVEHYVARDSATTGSMAGNVYLGRVQNVLPSMEAAFVDIGKGRNAVLYAGEVNWDAAGLEQNRSRRIENALSSGQSVLVQVTKDPIGHKGARLTSQISLPGRYLVYVPEGSMTGISRKLPDTERARLKKVLKEIVPADAGVIVRTAAEGASEAELTADVERLTTVWQAIQKKATGGSSPSLVHGEPDLTVRVVRDIFNEDFARLVVSGAQAWKTVSDYVSSVAPDLADRLSRWTDPDDLFAHHRIDEQLAKAMDRKVWLPSGGSLVIDRTEAMTVVDVNTGKFVGSGGNLEETVTKNNIEAAEEIVRQLRLRDIGGIIVIDFIDMVLESNRDLVVRRLLECLGRDRTKHQVAEVTSLGLVQMTRKRVGAGLIEVFSEPCEHCNGRGILVHTEPIDRTPASEAFGNGGRATRGRRARGGPQGGAAAAESHPPTEKPAAGPTPAQMAAAAYAAAVHASGHADSADPSDLQDAISSGAQGRAATGIAGAPDARDSGATTPDVGRFVDSTAAEYQSRDAPATRAVAVARRKRARVVAPAGPPRASTADEAEAAQPPMAHSDRPVDVDGDLGGSEPVD
ncbi:MAG TPA: Rne/Rng family ribonuclease [Dermatophilaceae bacterium]|nr:Rne/Rng family ribonuclease [Dermatophilaceae bacterium]